MRSVETAGVVGVRIEVESGASLRAKAALVCCGLQADRVARAAGLEPGRAGGSRPALRIVPLLGSYFDLKPECAARIRGLIYPVPDARFPFLGVHLTRRMPARRAAVEDGGARRGEEDAGANGAWNETTKGRCGANDPGERHFGEGLGYEEARGAMDRGAEGARDRSELDSDGARSGRELAERGSASRRQVLDFHASAELDPNAGRVDAGPNAALAFAREGYGRGAGGRFRLRDAASALSWPGTWKLVGRQASQAAAELWRSLSREAFAREAARLVPELTADWLVPARPGVRAQALGRDGKLVDDYVFAREGAMLHVLNAPSPAATASLAIAEELIEALG
ncbi:MAG: hypothetical protein H8D72_01845, partial [Planctomycetes bacterium]|nr:hypothetical protein [Planctomycetota bacterium]